MKLRIKFSKKGPLRFIGHLDIMRYFQKAIRRSDIDIAYSTGFSPHQIMSFAAPLGVGLESNGEYMDIEVNSIISCKDVVERLNKASVPGIEVISAVILPDNAGNAMASVAAASYTVRFREGRRPLVDLKTALPDFLAQEQILITKETKRGIREVDLKQGIYNINFDGESFYMLVDASSSGNIKPIQIIDALVNFCGETLQENALLVTREEVYTNIGTEDAPHYVALEEIGHE